MLRVNRKEFVFGVVLVVFLWSSLFRIQFAWFYLKSMFKGWLQFELFRFIQLIEWILNSTYPVWNIYGTCFMVDDVIFWIYLKWPATILSIWEVLIFWFLVKLFGYGWIKIPHFINFSGSNRWSQPHCFITIRGWTLT